MNEVLSKFDSGEIIGLVAVAGGILCGIVAIIAGVIGGIWQSVRKAEIAAGLKQDMLNRGMSPDDIKIVIEADPENARKVSVARIYSGNK